MKHKIYSKMKSRIIFVSTLGLLLSGCGYNNSKDSANQKYSATVAGYGGDVTVEVTATETGKIGTMRVDASKETPDIGGAAAPKLVKKIVAEQSLSVDAISGATITCDAILNAAETALQQAGIDTEALKK
ncbi:MAG: FMN-binding protein [Anaerocolumna sp.]